MIFATQVLLKIRTQVLFIVEGGGRRGGGVKINY